VQNQAGAQQTPSLKSSGVVVLQAIPMSVSGQLGSSWN